MKHDKTSWNAVQQICLINGDALLDGNAHSVRYGEMIHDGSGQPASANYQEEADSATCVMGNDAAEFVNKVKDPTTTMQTWIDSRLWLCRRSRRLKVNIRRSSVHFWESHVCANKLDMQETNFSFTQLYKSGNNFS